MTVPVHGDVRCMSRARACREGSDQRWSDVQAALAGTWLEMETGRLRIFYVDGGFGFACTRRNAAGSPGSGSNAV